MIREPDESGADVKYIQSPIGDLVHYRLACFHWADPLLPETLMERDPAEPLYCRFCDDDKQMHPGVQADVYSVQE